MADYKSPSDLYELLGSRFHNWHIAAAIAWAESHGDPKARSPNPDGGENRGLFQIDTNTAKAYGFDPNRLFEPQYNAMVASRISRRGKSWGPWETYHTGAYKKYVDKSHLPGKDSTVGQAADEIADATSGAAGTVKDAATAVPKFLGKLDVIFDAGWWLRAGQVLLGVAALVFGVNFFAKEFTGVSPLGTAAKVAAL